jgi:nucleoside-triphosphatase THEP1
MGSKEKRCILITGPVDTGKTTRARAWVERLRQRGLTVGGILTRAEYEGDRKCAYRAVDLGGGEERVLLDDRRRLEGQSIGRFSTSAAGFAWASAVLQRALEEGAEAICLDEAGPLELRGGGYAPIMERIAREFEGIFILVAREAVAEALEELLGRYGWKPERYGPAGGAAGGR